MNNYSLIVPGVLSASFLAAAVWLYRLDKSRPNITPNHSQVPPSNVRHEPTPAASVTHGPSSPIDEPTPRYLGANVMRARRSARSPPENVTADDFAPTIIYVLKQELHKVATYTMDLQVASDRGTHDGIHYENGKVLGYLQASTSFITAAHSVSAIITDKFKKEWSADAMCVFIQGLSNLWKATRSTNGFTDLTIRLPTTPAGILPPDNISEQPPFPPRMETLCWRGHMEQLPVFFRLDLPLSHLATLTLHCGISPSDCAYILRMARESLTHFEIRTINNAAGILQELPAGNPLIMSRLESLTIASELNINPMLARFSFPQVSRITMAISAENIDIRRCMSRFPRSNVREVFLSCGMTPEDESFLRNVFFPPTTLVNINRIPLHIDTAIPP